MLEGRGADGSNGRRREVTDLYATVLEVVKRYHGAARITRVSYGAGMPVDRLRNFVERLLALGLLRTEEVERSAGLRYHTAGSRVPRHVLEDARLRRGAGAADQGDRRAPSVSRYHDRAGCPTQPYRGTERSTRTDQASIPPDRFATEENPWFSRYAATIMERVPPWQ